MFHGKRSSLVLNRSNNNKNLKKLTTNNTSISTKENIIDNKIEILSVDLQSTKENINEKISTLTSDIELIKECINKMSKDINSMNNNLIKLFELSNKKFEELSNMLTSNPKSLISIQSVKK